MTNDILGPYLVLDDIRNGQLHLAAVVAGPEGADLPPVLTEDGAAPMRELGRIGATRLWRARFTRPLDAPSDYRWNGETFRLAGGLAGDMRIAFVSCNGQEHGDLDRPAEERNAMWARLSAEHDARPFSLLLHGGDQIYADEATHGHALSEDWPRHVPRDPPRRELDGLRSHLRQRFAERYLSLLRNPHYTRICARVPSLAQWDDHDICDG